LGERLGQRFRREINEKMNTLALKYFDRRKTGDTLSIIVNDSQTVAEGFFTAFVTFISAIVFAIGLVIAMFIES
jgi:ABC-type multidrug transport system fused ATPase/permease subunit